MSREIMKNAEFTEVEAEVIEDKLAVKVDFVPAEITADWDGMRAKLETMIEPYRGITPEIVRDMDVKEAKSCRADLNAISKELNDARKAIKKAYNAPLAAFEERVKELDALIKEPCEIIDRCIKEREQMEREDRREALRQAYEDYAPFLVDLVPFDRVLDDKWLNKTFGAKKAEAALLEKVEGIAKDWESFKRIKSQLRFPEETEAEFWRTLSLRDANEYDARRQAEAERIALLHANVEEHSPEPETTPYAEPEPRIVEEAEAFVDSIPEPETAMVYIFTFEITPTQRMKLIEWCRENGLHGFAHPPAPFPDMETAKKMVGAMCNG